MNSLGLVSLSLSISMPSGVVFPEMGAETGLERVNPELLGEVTGPLYSAVEWL